MPLRSLLFALLVAPALLFKALGQSATPAETDFTRSFPPFRMIGNVYWVGTYDLSTYLISTPEGHILINTGLAATLPQIKAGVEQMGFKFADVKILTATHAHFDHVAGMAELKRQLPGASLAIAEPDAALVEDGGKTDFRFGGDPRTRFEPTKVDRRLKNGDKIELGGVVLTAHLHPGHTKGATSFTFDVRENNRTYRVGIINMPSINPGVRVSGMPLFPGIADAYARTFHDQKEMKIDVWLASHAAQFGMHKKYKPGDEYNPDRFVDPQGFQDALAHYEKIYRDQLEKERQGN